MNRFTARLHMSYAHKKKKTEPITLYVCDIRWVVSFPVHMCKCAECDVRHSFFFLLLSFSILPFLFAVRLLLFLHKQIFLHTIRLAGEKGIKSEAKIEADERLTDERNGGQTKQKNSTITQNGNRFCSEALWYWLQLLSHLFPSLSLSIAVCQRIPLAGPTQHLCHNLPMQRNSYDNPRDCLHWLL